MMHRAHVLTKLQTLLRSPRLLHVRRNHALEHATIHILSQRYPQKAFVGRSDTRGFYIYGDLTSEQLWEAVQEALARLQRGDDRLAIHPNCGTNLIIAGFLGGTASYLTLASERDSSWQARLERLPWAILGTIMALLAAQPLGRAAQKHLTTEADMDSLSVTAIHRLHAGSRVVHRVITSL